MTLRIRLASVLLAAAMAVLTACGGSKPAAPAEQKPSVSGARPVPAPAAKPVEPAEEPLPPSELETQLPEGVREALLKPYTGDFDGMVKRRLIRIGVTFNRTFYFVDKGIPRGVVYDYGRYLEERLNADLKTGNMKVHVFFVPLPRDMLLPGLVEGKVDLVAAQLTVTPERQKLVDFTNPTRTSVDEMKEQSLDVGRNTYSIPGSSDWFISAIWNS